MKVSQVRIEWPWFAPGLFVFVRDHSIGFAFGWKKEGAMKIAIALTAASLLFTLNGCREAQTAKKSASDKKVLLRDDSSEVLIRHLLRRISDLTSEVSKRENEIVEHDNRCLKEQIAALEGRPINRAKSDPVASAEALGKGLEVGLNRMVQNLLDNEEAIEQHNRNHPESPQADLQDIIRKMCGDCPDIRATRELQIRQEAQPPAASSK
jgi:uncharacterized protein YlxW (UPF0749 family)